MRIAGGRFGGRLVKTPSSGATRPTQDRVREALFSMLAEVVPGSRFLDLYAGTGAVGIEALSRGASSVVWVEGDRAMARLIAENVAAIAGAEHAGAVRCGDVRRWISSTRGIAPFDIVFADPPYSDGRDGALADIAAGLPPAGLVTRRAVFVAEVPVDSSVGDIDGWVVLRDRSYGKSRLVIRQREI